jgi:hypothetical protein
VAEADLLRLVAFHAQPASVLEDRAPGDDVDALALGDGGESAREPSHHALALPRAQRLERDARLAELHAELARALGFADDGGHVQQRLGRDASLVEAGAAEALVGVHDDGLESQLRAPERRRVSAGPASDDDDVHFADEVAHHHRYSSSKSWSGRSRRRTMAEAKRAPSAPSAMR